MKIGNKSITGLLTFIPGVEFEHNDLILVDGNIYIVDNEEGFTADNITQVTDSSLGFCENYFEYISYDPSDPNANPNGPLSVTAFRTLLNQVIAGISDVGITDLILNSDGELDGVTNTAIYRVKFITTTTPSLTPDRYYLLRCYKTNSTYIDQELIDFYKGDIILRHFNGSNWSSNTLINGAQRSSMVGELSGINSKLEYYDNWIRTILSTGYTWFSVPVEDEYTNVYESLVDVNLLNVIITQPIDDNLYESVNRLVSLHYQGKTQFAGEGYILTVGKTGSTIKVSLESDIWRISSILANKPLRNV